MARRLNLLDKSIPPYQLILMLAWPTIIEQLLQTAVNYVDTIMVGSVGVNATAAIGVTTSTIWLINGLMNAVGVGYSVIVARRIGEGSLDEAKKTIRQAVLAIGATGVVLTLAVELVIAPNLAYWMGADAAVAPLAGRYFLSVGAAYLFNVSLVVCSNILRCTGDTKTPLKFNILTNIINVVGNFMLIYPTTTLHLGDWSMTLHRANLGVVGAGVATAIATAFSGTCMLLVLFRRKSPTQISLKEDFRPDKTVIRQALHLGAPTALERATISLGQMATTAIITGLGTVSLAAHQLANTGESLCYMPVFGFSVAGTTLVAQALGAGEKDLAYSYGRWCLRLAVAVMICTSSLMFAFASPIIDLFSNDLEVIRLGALMLCIEAFAEPFQAVGTVMGGVLRGAGDTRWPFYVSIAGMWCIRVPLALLLIRAFHWDLTAVWVAMAIDWVARATISLFRFYRKKWLTAWEKHSAPAA